VSSLFVTWTLPLWSVLQIRAALLALQFGNKQNMGNTRSGFRQWIFINLLSRSNYSRVPPRNYVPLVAPSGLNRPVNAVASTLLQSPSALAVRQQAMRTSASSSQSIPLKVDAAHAAYRVPSPSRRAFNPAGSPAPGFNPNSSTPVKDSSAVRASSPGRIKAPAFQTAASCCC